MDGPLAIALSTTADSASGTSWSSVPPGGRVIACSRLACAWPGGRFGWWSIHIALHERPQPTGSSPDDEYGVLAPRAGPGGAVGDDDYR
jgi:hypothetical protein